MNPALTEKETSDFTAGITLLIRGDQYFALRSSAGAWAFLPCAGCFGCAFALPRIIENSVSGIGVRQELKLFNLKAIACAFDGDKVRRAHRITPVLQAGRIALPRRARWLDELLTEARAFPIAGAHEDQVDALVQAINWVEARKRRQRLCSGAKCKFSPGGSS